MTQPIGSGADRFGDKQEPRIARRDWVLLPLTGMLTIGLLVLASTFMARQMFPQSSPSGYASIFDCIRGTDSPDHMHGNENAVCRGNARDEPIEDYRLNSQGFRSEMDLGPKQPDVYRIVMVGSSVAMGEGVAMNQSMASLLPGELSLAAGRRVEIYNESMIDQLPDSIASHFSAILPAQPDMILWVVTAHDISEKVDPQGRDDAVQIGATVRSGSVNSGTLLGKALRRLRGDLSSQSPSSIVSDLWQHALSHYGSPPAIIMLQHFLFESQSQYIRSYLMGTKEGGYLKIHMDSEWQNDLRRFDRDDARIEAQAKASHIQLATVLIPDRAQATMVSMGKCPAGYDPYTFANEVRAIVVRHGGTYVDIVSAFRGVPNPERYYFEVSNHPNARGHKVLSELLTKAMTNGAIPALRAVAKPQLAAGAKL